MPCPDDTAILTSHARLRRAQRHFSLDDIGYVLAHGEHLLRTGVTFVYLRRRDIPAQHQGTRWAKLEGTCVILGQGGGIVTVYRSANPRTGYREIRKKSKYRLPGLSAKRSPGGERMA